MASVPVESEFAGTVKVYVKSFYDRKLGLGFGPPCSSRTRVRMDRKLPVRKIRIIGLIAYGYRAIVHVSVDNASTPARYPYRYLVPSTTVAAFPTYLLNWQITRLREGVF